MREPTVQKSHSNKQFLLPYLLLIAGFLIVGTNSFAETTSGTKNTAETKSPVETKSDSKMTAEAAFMQGQQYLQQGNIPLAEVSLTRIPPSSPYSKLLAGNIAVAKDDTDRAFLLLLPLQSNTSLSKPAAASLHASLSNAYEKQGDTVNALSQLINQEAYVSGQAVEDNYQNIWRLLSNLPAPDLIALRGEATDTTTQGWIDLNLAAKNPDMASELANWFNSYPDHPAATFAKNLATTKSATAKIATSLPLPGNIALILPFDDPAYADKANAFRMGLQAALDKNAIPNTIRGYSSLGDTDNFGDLYAYARDEGASYFIGPMQINELIKAGKPEQAKFEIHALSLLDNNLVNDNGFQNIGFSLQDEAQAIATFAKTHAIQHVSIVTIDDKDAAQRMAEAFQSTWSEQGYEANVIALPQGIQPGNSSLLDLKTKLATADMVLLAMPGDQARIVRPYLDISTPTLTYSSIRNGNDVAGSNLNAIRFADIPFLLDKDNSLFAYYQKQAAGLETLELKRWFALGVDALQLLIADFMSDSNAPTGSIINGLTGKLVIDRSGNISRQLSLGRFTYDSVVLDN